VEGAVESSVESALEDVVQGFALKWLRIHLTLENKFVKSFII